MSFGAMRLLVEHFQNREILSYAFKCITQYFLDFRRTTVAACAMSEPAVQSTLSARQRGRLDQVVGERQSNRSIVYARIGHCGVVWSQAYQFLNDHRPATLDCGFGTTETTQFLKCDPRPRRLRSCYGDYFAFSSLNRVRAAATCRCNSGSAFAQAATNAA